jgi:hypothetical protein
MWHQRQRVIDAQRGEVGAIPWFWIALVLAVLICGQAVGQDRSAWPENDWTEHLCREHQADGWESQVRTPDGSYVDVLTPTHAIEVEWPAKWKEAVGQCLYYAIATERQPGIVLLVKDWRTEQKYYLRCLAVCARHNIRLIAVEAK